MPEDRDESLRSSRDKKVAGRAKRRKYMQGTRAYLHALTNSVARRASDRGTKDGDEKGAPR